MTLLQATAMMTTYSQYDLWLVEGESPSHADLCTAVNWARRTVNKRRAKYEGAVALTLAADKLAYSFEDTTLFAKRMLRVMDGWIAKQPVRNHFGRRGVWNWTAFNRSFPNWPYDPSGTPVLMAANARTLYVYPAPNAAFIAANATGQSVSGQVIENDFKTDGTDDAKELPEPVFLHEAVAFLAVCHSAVGTVNESDAWQRLAAYDKSAVEAVDEEARESRMLQQPFGDPPASRVFDW